MMKKICRYLLLVVICTTLVGYLWNIYPNKQINLGLFPNIKCECQPLDHKPPEKHPSTPKPIPKEPPKYLQPPPGRGSDPSNPTPPGDPQLPCPGCG